MRKKCVLWAKPVLVTLAVIIAASVQWSDGTLSAQSSPDPSTLPRLQFADLVYQGAFRMPRTVSNGEDFSYGGLHLAYNPARNSLFGSSLHNNVAEVTIPAPVNTTDVNQMLSASYLQGFADPTEGHFREVEQGGPNPAVLAGLLVSGNKLYATGSIYYDAMNSQVVSHFSRSTTLSDASFSGWSQVWETGKAGFVGGYMSQVPDEWQSLLGGPALTGQCCIPIVTRTSFGPAAFGFDPAGIGAGASIPATPLMYYTKEHATLGPWEGSNPWYGATTGMGGLAVIAGTRTALFIGRNGQGAYCYGHGVSDPALGGTRASDGQLNCYDPASSDKGMHAYPYRYQIWAYDLADLAAVKAGTKQPWDVVPYGVWPFDLPTPGRSGRIGGVAYDAQRQLLYIAQDRADVEGYSERPIIHTLKLNAPSSTAPPPLSTTVSLAPDVSAPQAPGALIRWSAAAAGGKAPYEYKWVVYANGAWSMLRDWSASGTFDWQPDTVAVDARMAVWVRPAPEAQPADQITADSGDATAEYPFAIVNPSAEPADTESGSSPVASVALTTDLAAPQPAGSTIVWTATPTGGSGAQVYKWFVFDGGQWTPVGSWSASNQFTWTPSSANPNYRISAWVKRESNPKDEWESSSERPFLISEAGSTSSSSSSSTPEPTSTPVAGLALTTNVTAPQAASSTIVWTAIPAGGSGALVYKWFVFDGGQWTPVGSWAASNQFTWTPSSANPNYRVSAWVKRASSPKDEWEATSEQPFAIIASTASPAPVVPRVTPAPPAETVPPTTAPAVPPTAPAVALPAVTVASTTVAAGAAIQFSVSGGPANRLDWVSIAAVAAADTSHVRWMYLNGTSTTPATGTGSATLQFTAPSTPGSYNIRFFADNGYAKLATSATIVVGDPGVTAASATTPATTAAPTTAAATTGPAVTVATTTVQAGAPIEFTVSGRRAHPLDWVSISATSAANTSHVRWMYLNGTSTTPTSGIESAALQFTAPATPGTYNIRFFADNGYARLATSATITVSAASTTTSPVTTVAPLAGPAVSVATTTAKPGAVIAFTVSGGPANRLDWVSLSATTAADTSYVRWLYLNGSTTVPASGAGAATLQFIAPSTAGTYNIRFFADNGFKKLASSATVTVAP